MKKEFINEAEFERFICENFIDEIARRSARTTLLEVKVLRYKRQARLGTYGIADIVIEFEHASCKAGYNKEKAILVVELKNTTIKAKDFAQLCRYMAAIDSIYAPEQTCYGLVIGPKDIVEDISYMPFYFNNIDFLEFSYDGDTPRLYDIAPYRKNDHFDFNKAMEQ